MTQTRYRLINGADYEYLEEGKAYEPDYRAAETGPKIIDLVTAFPSDWEKVRHRPNRKRVTAAMYNQVVAERDEAKTRAEAFREKLAVSASERDMAHINIKNMLEDLRKEKRSTWSLGNQIKAAEKKIGSQQKEIDLYIVLLVITLLTSAVGWWLALA